MTKGSLIEYQALKIAQLEQENDELKAGISAQLYGNSGSITATLRCVAAKYGVAASRADFTQESPCERAEAIRASNRAALGTNYMNGGFGNT